MDLIYLALLLFLSLLPDEDDGRSREMRYARGARIQGLAITRSHFTK